MKILVLKIILFLTAFNLLYGQEVRAINCVILIDDDLVDDLTGTLFSDDFQIEFGYEVGEIRMTTENYNLLKSLDENIKLSMKMMYSNLDNGNNIHYEYFKDLEVKDFRQRYFILRICNCKKGKYKVFYESPRYHNPRVKCK